MRIRPADAADVPVVAAIVAAAYAHYVPRIGRAPGPMGDDYAALVRSHAVWVAEDEAGIAGLVVLLAEADHLLLDNVAVDPGRHGQGVGRALMIFAEAEARRRGCTEMRLYTHEKMVENVAMYARAGWTETGRGEQAGFSRVFFRKPV